MKASELMVGDYITFSDVQNDSNCPKLKVIAINEEDVYVLNDGDPVADLYDIKELSGIPITPEILENNGFAKEKEDELGITYYFLARPFITQITLYKEPIGGVSILFKVWGRVPSSEGGVNDIHLCSVKYVHEMQHALRLCGIEKEIEL